MHFTYIFPYVVNIIWQANIRVLRVTPMWSSSTVTYVTVSNTLQMWPISLQFTQSNKHFFYGGSQFATCSKRSCITHLEKYNVP
uniref:Uncharacterized protein n=1 Tax=Pararge aegeria TaxID=116150 RepID=S4P5N2_9NEOP